VLAGTLSAKASRALAELFREPIQNRAFDVLRDDTTHAYWQPEEARYERSEQAMSSALESKHCEHAELVCAYAVQALPSIDISAVEAHISSCSHCRGELAALRPIVDSFVSWPTDVLRPAPSLQERLARRISAERGAEPAFPAARQWSEPEWEEVAPGISCKLWLPIPTSTV